MMDHEIRPIRYYAITPKPHMRWHRTLNKWVCFSNFYGFAGVGKSPRQAYINFHSVYCSFGARGMLPNQS